MKKFTIWMVLIGIVFSLVSCSKKEDSTIVDIENYTRISAKSIEELSTKLRNDPQITDPNSIILFAQNENLVLPSLVLKYVHYERYMDDNMQYDGRWSLNFYWGFDDGVLYHTEKIDLHLFYIPNGVDQSATYSYTKDENSDLYTKEGMGNTKLYVFVIDQFYYCDFVIEQDVENMNDIVERLSDFCKDVQVLRNA